MGLPSSRPPVPIHGPCSWWSRWGAEGPTYSSLLPASLHLRLIWWESGGWARDPLTVLLYPQHWAADAHCLAEPWPETTPPPAAPGDRGQEEGSPLRELPALSAFAEFSVSVCDCNETSTSLLFCHISILAFFHPSLSLPFYNWVPLLLKYRRLSPPP